MTKILVVYGTSYGQTEKIVRRIAADLKTREIEAVAINARDVHPTLRVDEFDGFLVAASVIGGHHQRYVEKFVREHLEQLRYAPSAFLSVSGAAGTPTPAGQAEARKRVEEFFQATGWRPPVTATFGGSIAYTKYNFLLRWMIKQINKRKGGPTDTTRDHETTDWNAVDRFAAELAHTFHRVGVASPSPSHLMGAITS